MIAISYSRLKQSLKTYCERANDEAETIIVTRKSGGNVVLMSEDQYNNPLESISRLRRHRAQYPSGEGGKP